MGEEVAQNTDSFVDTVGNTVGILIILVIMSIAVSGKKAGEVDVNLQNLHRLTADVETKQRNVADGEREKAEKLEVLTKIEPKRKAALDRLGKEQESYQVVKGRADQLGRKTAALTASLEELKASREKAAEAIRTAEVETAKARDEFAGTDLARLGTQRLEEMASAVASLTEKADALTREAEVAEARKAELAARVAELEALKKQLDDEVAVLREQAEIDIVIRDPVAPVDYAKKAVWVECYVPVGADGAKGLPSLRIVNEENYVKESREGKTVLVPRADGEDVTRISDRDSLFNRYIVGHDREFKGKYRLYFVVRPDAYVAFLAARRMAVAARWDVRWDPVEAGQELVIRAAP